MEASDRVCRGWGWVVGVDCYSQDLASAAGYYSLDLASVADYCNQGLASVVDCCNRERVVDSRKNNGLPSV
ncbi:hypothetical protein [Pseudomonas sp. 2995-1]|uniref:hypothetical protein n=1 Tax=Pseudomonas sp. 2995-1 TaxID=1712679 RepID=UPI000C149000|nr:hypothetical protein [Pseudomonas sp. 2995-1]